MNRSWRFNNGHITLTFLAAMLLIALPLYSAAGQSGTSKSPASSSSANMLPDGPGKNLVLKDCQSCHSLQNVTSHRGNADDWAQVISQMIGRGANISDDDADTLVDYLSAHFGATSPRPAESSSPGAQKSAPNSAAQSRTSPEKSSTVNVNEASADNLQADLGLPKDQAEAIVQYRQKNGDFKNLQQLLAVPRVNAEKLKDEQNKITF